MNSLAARPARIAVATDSLAWLAKIAFAPLQLLMSVPSLLCLGALTTMLLRHPDVAFYEIDRVAFGLLVIGVLGRALLLHQPLFVMARVTWPMLGLIVLALASVAGKPFDNETWSLLASKFIVPFAMFHLAGLAFTTEKQFHQFELFALAVLAYLSFTAVAFLVGAHSLIFPRFILDESLGFHADRARGPLLQAVANGVSLNVLGLLAWHAFRRSRARGIAIRLLLASVPIAILATMTRAVWLSFAGTVVAIVCISTNRGRWRACAGLGLIALVAFLGVLSVPGFRDSLSDRLQEKGPVEFRTAVYSGGWQMFLERPLMGWGFHQMPFDLPRHVSGYKEKVLYPHNTYLEVLVEFGAIGLVLYLLLMWELLRLHAGPIPDEEKGGFLGERFHRLWPILLGVYWINAAVVVMSYQFVNALLFAMAGMLAAQRRRAITF